jgi:hypothetical protein
MDKSQLFINELKNIFVLIQRESEQAASVPALPAPEPTYADKSLTLNLPGELIELYQECLKKYGRKFGKDGTKPTTMMRVLLLHFIENWESMPMEKAWSEENNRNFRISSSNRGRGKMRLTVSGI